MSVEAITWAIKTQDLGSTEKLLLVMLSNYSNADYVAWASESHLAKVCNCTTRTIRRGLKILSDKKLLKIIPKFDNGRQVINDYILEVGGTPVSTPSRTSVSTHNTKVNKTVYTEGFNKFWSVYPRPVQKYYANNIWNKVTKEIPSEKIISATKLFVKKMNGTEEKYIPHPSTYLNKRMFMDVDTVVKVRKSAIAG